MEKFLLLVRRISITMVSQCIRSGNYFVSTTENRVDRILKRRFDLKKVYPKNLLLFTFDEQLFCIYIYIYIYIYIFVYIYFTIHFATQRCEYFIVRSVLFLTRSKPHTPSVPTLIKPTVLLNSYTIRDRQLQSYWSRAR
jgi:hypothetical protein